MSRRTTLASCTIVALTFVLGASPLGSAAERLVLPPNSVGTAQLKPAAVTAAKIRPRSLTASLNTNGVRMISEAILLIASLISSRVTG